MEEYYYFYFKGTFSQKENGIIVKEKKWTLRKAKDVMPMVNGVDWIRHNVDTLNFIYTLNIIKGIRDIEYGKKVPDYVEVLDFNVENVYPIYCMPNGNFKDIHGIVSVRKLFGASSMERARRMIREFELKIIRNSNSIEDLNCGTP